MIDLIPGHGWLDLAGVVIMVLAAFGVFSAWQQPMLGSAIELRRHTNSTE